MDKGFLSMEHYVLVSWGLGTPWNIPEVFLVLEKWEGEKVVLHGHKSFHTLMDSIYCLASFPSDKSYIVLWMALEYFFFATVSYVCMNKMVSVSL